MRHIVRCFQQTVVPSLLLQSCSVWAMMSNVSLEVRTSHTNPYINTSRKKSGSSPRQLWLSPASFTTATSYVSLYVWQEVSAKWLCNICPQDCHLLWAWLPGSLSALSWYFNQSKCWLIEVQTETVWVNLSFNKKMSGHDSWMSMRYFPVCGMSLKDQKMYCPICLNYEEVIKGRSWIGQAVLTLESLLHLKMQKSSSIKSIIIYFYYTFIPFNCIIFFTLGRITFSSATCLLNIV